MFENKLGGYFQKETKELEFKEFCIKTPLDLFLSPQEADEILKEKIWNIKLQHVIIKNLNIYIESILPKYIATFSNSNIYGSFYIGINDFGEITGIPSMGELDIVTINTFIKESVIKNIKLYKDNSFIGLTDTQINHLLYNINCSIKLLDKDDFLITDETSKLYEKYKKNLIKSNDTQFIYNKERIKWLLNLSKYATKLKDLLNTTETRNELIQYMFDNGIAYDNEMINLLNEKTFINIPEYETLQIRKIDKNDIMYWLVKFKDFMAEKIVQQRPDKPLPIKIYSPHQIIQKLSLMRNIFIQDPQINYYLIKITINGSNINEPLYFNNYGEWIFRRREEHDDGSPYSI